MLGKLYDKLIPDRPIIRLDVWVHTGNMTVKDGKVVGSQVVQWEFWEQIKDKIKPEIYYL